MPDYRVKVGYLDHPKTRKLRRQLGDKAVEFPMRLWEFCATTPSRCDGDLSGLENESIADICRWDGDPDELVRCLRGPDHLPAFLDGEDGAYRIHDLEDHNPFVVHHAERSAKAKAAARARWGGDKVQKKKRPAAPKKKKKTEKPAARASEVQLVFDHYRIHHPQAHKKPSPSSKEWRNIVARMREGATVKDLCEAIDGCHRSAFHMGDNSRGKRYDSLELITRDASHVQQFMEVPENGERPQVRSQFVDATRAVAEWARSEDDKAGVLDADDQVAGLLPKRT